VKRFYVQVAISALGHGVVVTLDGRPVKTPRKHPLALTTEALAQAVAAEWAAQEGDIRPAGMPQTRLATTAIDRVRPARVQVISDVAAYGATDLVCYHADGDDELLALQQARWQPFRDWLATRHGIRLATTGGILHVAQPPEAVARFHALVAAHDDMGLTALADLVNITGSLAIGLGLAGGTFDLEAGWQAAFVDELYQATTWGEDYEAVARRERLKAELASALRFIELAGARARPSP
jgi:chaperone required for assembly of F1-ATPase